MNKNLTIQGLLFLLVLYNAKSVSHKTKASKDDICTRSASTSLPEPPA